MTFQTFSMKVNLGGTADFRPMAKVFFILNIHLAAVKGDSEWKTI